jgi:hypothetical protein
MAVIARNAFAGIFNVDSFMNQDAPNTTNSSGEFSSIFRAATTFFAFQRSADEAPEARATPKRKT